MLNEPNDALLAALKCAVGPKGWTEPGENYLTEPRGLWRGKAAIVLRPASTDEVAACVKHCAAARVGIVPWGGGTGLVAGQVSTEGPAPVLLSLDRMRAVRRSVPDESAIIVDAGMPLKAVQEAAAADGLLFPLSYASEGTASIGGGLATNAGGLQAIRYGVARDLCLGLEVVTAEGDVWDGLTTLRKDNTGYDLRDLYIGSEGTLGVICAAALRLYPQPAARAAAFIALDRVEDAIALMNALQATSGGAVAVAELLPEFGIELVLRARPNLRVPVERRARWYLLAELWGMDGDGLHAALESVLSPLLEEGKVVDASVALNEEQRLAFRAIRETLPEAQKTGGLASIKHDISLPVSAIPAFLERAAQVVDRVAPGARPCPFGHLGDGNLHYNVSQPEHANPAAYLARWDAMNDAVHEIVTQLRGSISAEHGIGRLKRESLMRFGDPVKLSLLRRLKTAFDPDGIMNPGALLSTE